MMGSESPKSRPSSRQLRQSSSRGNMSFVSKDIVITPLARCAPVVAPQKPSTPSRSPEDFVVEDLDEVVLEEYLSESRLMELAQTADLSQVKFLEICVDTTYNSLGKFGEYLPNLRELKLNDSKITSIRHLGTTLTGLEILWMSRCQLADLEGAISLSNLKELYLAFNQIKDLSPLHGLDQLQVLDIESNSIKSIETIEFLAGCPMLTSVTLEDNPISEIPYYRTIIARAITSLEQLDDIPLDDTDREERDSEVESQIKDVMEKFARCEEDEEQSIESISKNFTFVEVTTESPMLFSRISDRPSTSSGRPSTSARPASSLSMRPQSSRGRLRTPTNFSPELDMFSFEPMETQPFVVSNRSLVEGLALQSAPNALALEDDASSQLTYGSEDIFCGNPVMALRNRKGTSRQSDQPFVRSMDSFSSKMESLELSYTSSPPLSALSSPSSHRQSLSRSSRPNSQGKSRPDSRTKSNSEFLGSQRPDSSGSSFTASQPRSRPASSSEPSLDKENR
eukprot:TRINITY_DN7204_c0_g2_i2.p1 TRINITY_DN7204_c0_g2~~TRINITY_DN7204_c0_g2_i2.p1  ORF type:complete len:510 (+),score=106.01 TRINITY_DN7204_c0_g2_i2:91-1620(+)